MVGVGIHDPDLASVRESVYEAWIVCWVWWRTGSQEPALLGPCVFYAHPGPCGPCGVFSDGVSLQGPGRTGPTSCSWGQDVSSGLVLFLLLLLFLLLSCPVGEESGVA